MTGRRFFFAISWVPLALYLVSNAYVNQFEGWGQWAAAPVLLPSLFLSIGIGAWGMWLAVLHWRRRRKADVAMILAAILAGSVALYLFIGG